MHKLIVVIVILFFAGCQNSDWLDFALQAAKENRGEMELVLKHYPSGSLKHEAAVFLIENMPYRHSLTGRAIEIFRDSVSGWNRKTSLNKIWNSVSRKEFAGVNTNPDIEKITSGYLIEDIDFAFEIWEAAPWKDSISFDMFKEYILPYSIDNDQPLTAWRKPLHDKYLPIIEGVDSPKEAFDKLYVHIVKNFKLIDASDYFYVADPLIVNATMRGTCDVRTMYIVSVARSLCIPAAFDYVSYWANYIDMGHSWAAYIDRNNQTYVLSEYDKISHKGGIIDATYFPSTDPFDASVLPFTVDSIKKIAKVSRRSFEVILRQNLEKENCPYHLQRSDYKDVSSSYNLKNRLEIKIDTVINGNIYLCNFVARKNWTPIYVDKQSGKQIIFENIGGDIVYLPAIIEEEKIIPLSNPVIVKLDNSQEILNPDLSVRRSVTLWRKYLLFTRWLPNRWSKNIGVAFEASNDPEFKTKDTLHLVTQMPIGITNIEVKSEKAYRYLRITPPDRIRLTMSEVSFYGINDEGKEVDISGKMIYRHIPEERAHRLFDKDYLTEVTAKPNYYWVGYDLGKGSKIKVSRISYCPWNDGNMIEPNDEYELLYYNMGWHSLGKKIAEKESIMYEGVPDNALLWLRNLTKGKEERIFTYKKGKQVWW